MGPKWVKLFLNLLIKIKLKRRPVSKLRSNRQRCISEPIKHLGSVQNC